MPLIKTVEPLPRPSDQFLPFVCSLLEQQLEWVHRDIDSVTNELKRLLARMKKSRGNVIRSFWQRQAEHEKEILEMLYQQQEILDQIAQGKHSLLLHLNSSMMQSKLVSNQEEWH